MNGPESNPRVSRQQLIELLNADLSREYQAIIGYVVYSQALKGAAYMKIAAELKKHAAEELEHALIVARQVDYLGGMPTAVALPVKISERAEDMLRFDLDNENQTIRHYRQRVRQCEALGEYALAENIRKILVQEQEHQNDLATALGVDVPDVAAADEQMAAGAINSAAREAARRCMAPCISRRGTMRQNGPPRSVTQNRLQFAL